ncbi:DUF1499 domain-containing protein [Chengkuizengella axinellae]|uniref:DUF1499 domain-containing protein n=1 Tax=Chengkuizengella axinellae TaxID=3064388 RepID=A0ABT9J6H2_9BACL|nr:DUF1499 domain-containing protein [Chengkuizengella sp. 2205SS18-9]MDP5277179.1 DUF1499 domain-containing protein [Chengkuizengella sp. 2205SS18-9]
MKKKIILITFIIIVLLYTAFIVYNQYSDSTASGVIDGKLAECPDSPNCVSTKTMDGSKIMEPIPYTNSTEAFEILVKVINEMPGTKIINQDSNYLHVTFTSRVFRFVDDVEFYFDEQEKFIHFRSASRTGYSDLGVNQERMDKITNRMINEM